MRPSLKRLGFLLVAGALSSLSCGREITGPEGARRGRLPELAPRFPVNALATDGTSLVAFERVRIVVRRSAGEVAASKTVTMPPDAEAIDVSLEVPLSGNAPEGGEPMSLTLAYVNVAGDTVFRGGPVSVLVRQSRAGEPSPQPLDVELTYTGTGANAARVAITPDDLTFFAGDPPFQFNATAYDGQDAAIAGTPVRYRSSDPSVVVVDDAGSAVAQPKRGTAFVIAALYTGQEDTATVEVLLRASTIVAVSGSGQSGMAGTPLAQPVVVRTLAADGVPVAGVPVAFAAQGGGLPTSTVATTDAAGEASVTWTLGGTPGPQTLTATAAGLTGSPVTFTATAGGGVATQLAFSTPPANTVAGAAIGAVVEARTAGGFLASGFQGEVTIEIGANPGDASLGGLTTVTAVNGVATFTGLTIERAAAGYTLVASASGLTDATSTPFAITPAAASILTFVVEPVGAAPGGLLVPSPTVGALDAFGNLTAVTTPVTIALGANPGGAVLSGTTTVAPVAGVAIFTNLSLDAAGLGYTLVASATGVDGATSSPFVVGALSIAWINASGGSWSDPSNWSLGRIPNAGDIVDITLAGTYTVTMDDSPTVGSIILGGADGTQTLVMSSRTLTLGNVLVVEANGVFTATNSTIGGNGPLAATGTVTLVGSTVNVPVTIVGTLIASGTSTINGVLGTDIGAMVRVGQVDGSTSVASLTVSDGFVNGGTIDLTVLVAQPYSSQLAVTNGILFNAASGTIRATAGTTAGGARILAATVVNQGLLEAQVPLTINRSGSTHDNSGTIDVTAADLTIQQSGGGASFSNAGTITLGAGRTLSISGGTVFLAGGSVNGSGTLALSSTALALDVHFTNAVTGLSLNNVAITGSATLTNANGRTLTLVATTVNVPFVNDGTLLVSGASAIGGTFTASAGSTLRVGQVDGSTSMASLTVANGFMNNGTIDLTVLVAQPYSSQLTVTNGTLVNSATGVIRAEAGAAGGGTRTLVAELDNQGLLDVQVPLSINRLGSAHLNSGNIDLTVADLTLAQSGGGASFTNNGTITLGSGRLLAVSGGAVALASGTVTGPGAVTLTSATLTLGVGFSNSVTGLGVVSSTIDGPGTLTNAPGQILTLVGSTVNAVLDNQGTLIASGTSVINGALTMPTGSILRVGQVDGSTSVASLTVAAGFVNNGTIELTVLVAQPYSSQLAVTSGALVNSTNGIIRSLGGAAPGGTRTLVAQLDNQGLIETQVTTSVTRASVAHVNSGTIDASLGSFLVLQSGLNPSFTNDGTVTVGTGISFSFTGGQFTNTPFGTLTGPGLYAMNTGSATFDGAVPGIARVILTSASATFASPIDVGVLALNLTGATVTAPSVTVPVGVPFGLNGSTLNAAVNVQGPLVVSGNSAINGTVTTGSAALFQIGQQDGATSLAHLTVANGFTNNGEIRLTVIVGTPYNAQLSVTNGTLVNAGTIALVPGAAPGGTRTIAAQIENQGSIVVTAPSTLGSSGADHVNMGTISISGADLTVNQSGTTPSFTNTSPGSIMIGAGRTFAVNGGAFASEIDATIQGPGTLAFSNVSATFDSSTPSGITLALTNTTAFFDGDIFAGDTPLVLSGSTLNGSGSLINGPGETLTLRGTTINMPVENSGTLVVSGASAITGSLETAAGSIIRIGQVDGATSVANLTVPGFTNEGAIELTVMVGTAYNTQLTLSSGTLVNAEGGTITTLDGLAAGGTRTIVGAVDNQGTITVGPGTAGRLNITGSLVTSGTLELEIGGTTADTQYDRIVVTGGPGSLSLGGVLNVGLINGFTPGAGNTFGILSALARTGTFEVTDLPPVIASPPTYGATGVTLTVP